MAPMIHAFSQDRASRVTGLSVRQLQYWDETDVLKPSIALHDMRGLPRLYSFTDLLRLATAKLLRDHRMLPSEIKRMVANLEEIGFDEPLLTLSFVSVKVEGSSRLVKDVFWVNPRTGALQSARGSTGQTVEVFDQTLVELRTGIEGKVAELTNRTPGKVVRIRGLRGHAPVLDGTRVPTAKLKALADAGWSQTQLKQAFPQLTDQDVRAAIAYERKRARAA